MNDGNMKKIINLTPHEITITDPGALTRIKIPPSGQVARVAMLEEGYETTQTIIKTQYGKIPLSGPKTWGPVTGFPDKLDEDTLYIVSSIVVAGLKTHRCEDVYRQCVSPGDLVRDEFGIIIGCRTLIQA